MTHDVIDLFRCTRCDGIFSGSEMFRTNKMTETGRCRNCRVEQRKNAPSSSSEHVNRYNSRWKRNNPEKCKDSLRKSKYGMLPGTYQAMTKDQAGKCAICHEAPEKALHVDHDHDSGVIRALLCDTCNRGLGYFRDSSELLLSAANYLKGYGK